MLGEMFINKWMEKGLILFINIRVVVEKTMNFELREISSELDLLS